MAVAGLGAVGFRVAAELDSGIAGLALAAVAARNRESAARRIDHFRRAVPVLPIESLEPAADLVVECAPGAHLRAIVEPFVAAGKTAIVLSAGALLEQFDLVARLKNGWPVVAHDEKTVYTVGPKGLIDYPVYDAKAAESVRA